MKRAVILDVTGVLGRAIAWRHIRAAWAVDVTGRDTRKMPRDLAEAGARVYRLRTTGQYRSGGGDGRRSSWMRCVSHTTAAVNTAALVEHISGVPGARVLNSADPDAPNARQIARTIARHLGHQWDEVLLDETAPEGIGDHPWGLRPPIILSTVASLELGYEPVGTDGETIARQIDCLLNTAASGADPAAQDSLWRSPRPEPCVPLRMLRGAADKRRHHRCFLVTAHRLE